MQEEPHYKMKRCNKYLIMATENYGGRRTLHSFKTFSQANKKLKQILSKPSKPSGNQTAYRVAQSGAGINNPRIKKIRGFC